MKKYVVTDPSYILSNEDWDKCCEIIQYNGPDDKNKWIAFNQAIAGKLAQMTGEPAYVEDTGFGDWSNEIYGPGVLNHTFAADAGMVCVCRLTEEIEKKLNIKEHDSCVAVFEADELVKVTFDTDDETWTVINIVTDKGLIVSNSPEEDEEDEED